MLNITAQTAAVLDLMKALEPFGARLPNAQANVLNRVGTKTRNAVIPALTKQTGLSKRIITKAVKMARASPQNPRVMLITRGGEISLRYFGAHEEGGGVAATVKGDRMFYAGAFRRSGPKGRRQMVPKLNGQVYVNEAGGRWGSLVKKETGKSLIRVKKSGVYIPVATVTGETAKAFWRVVETDMLVEVERELAKLLPGGRV